MTSVAFQSFIRMNPFRAFQLHTKSGAVYRVGDPELIQVTAGTVTLLARVQGTGQSSPVAVIDLTSVTSLDFATPTPETP